MHYLQTIKPDDLICMDDPKAYRVDLAYARADNLLFGERIYKETAKLWLHKDLARIVTDAARYCLQNHNKRFILYDGLRTVEAQAMMLRTRRVQDNPHWLRKPRLLSPPGAGGHPRGMAIDIGLETLEGTLLDMGTPFDFLAQNPNPEANPAHRDYKHPTTIINNRAILDNSMRFAAEKHNLPLHLLPQEWWDFRLPPEVYNQYAPLNETNLPARMRLI